MAEKGGFFSHLIDFLTSIYARNLKRNFSKNPEIVSGLQHIVDTKKRLQSEIRQWCIDNPKACASMRKSAEDYRRMTNRPLYDPVNDPWDE